jgi:hypothetical protein
MGKRRADKLEEIQAFDRARGQLPHRKEAVKARAPRYKDKPYRQIANMRAKDPLKAQARMVLGNAIQNGKIVRPDRCEVCGKECTPHGHHADYSKSLEVVWVCSECHGLITRIENEIARN